MPRTLKLGQILKGRLGCYAIQKQLWRETVWLAIDQQYNQNVIVKYADHWRVRNERDILLRYQDRTPHIRPLLDEIEDESKNLILILKYLDTDSLQALDRRRLTPAEVKKIGKGVLEGLRPLHHDGFVHTDIKPSNILLNIDPVTDQITDVKLADFESAVSETSKHARNGEAIGTAMFRSTEAQLNMSWGRPTDVWSFGATLISLLYGDGFHVFNPGVSVDDDEYDLKIVFRHNGIFGPFPVSYQEIADEGRIEVLTWIMNNTPEKDLKPFSRTTTREISKEDKEFILKIMKLDPRDRPTVEQLLEDGWFSHI